MSRQLGCIILSGYAALTAIIMDYHSTFITKQASLPPWAVELNQNIDTQVIGKIIKIIEDKSKKPTLYIQIHKYLTNSKSKKITQAKKLSLRVNKKVHKELINSLEKNSSTTSNSSYLISFKEKNDGKVKYLELVTIDPYISE